MGIRVNLPLSFSTSWGLISFQVPCSPKTLIRPILYIQDLHTRWCQSTVCIEDVCLIWSSLLFDFLKENRNIWSTYYSTILWYCSLSFWFIAWLKKLCILLTNRFASSEDRPVYEYLISVFHNPLKIIIIIRTALTRRSIP